MTSRKQGITRWLAFGAGVAALALTTNAHAERLAFRTGTSAGTVVFDGDTYTFSPSNSAAWGNGSKSPRSSRWRVAGGARKQGKGGLGDAGM